MYKEIDSFDPKVLINDLMDDGEDCHPIVKKAYASVVRQLQSEAVVAAGFQA